MKWNLESHHHCERKNSRIQGGLLSGKQGIPRKEYQGETASVGLAIWHLYRRSLIQEIFH